MNKSLAKDINLLELPGIRHWMMRYRQVLFTNETVLNQSKTHFYRELALSLKAGIPLCDALILMNQTHGDRMAKQGYRVGGMSRFLKFLCIIAALILFIFFLITAWFIIIPMTLFSVFFLAFRNPGYSQVAKKLALQLLPMVEKGYSLSEAMESLPSSFSKGEVVHIRCGETLGDLVDTLLERAEMSRRRTLFLGSNTHLIYAFFMLSLVSSTVRFINVHIMPKYEDIYGQLGGALPGITMSMRDGFYLYDAPMMLLLPLVSFFLLRTMMTGNRMGQTLVFLNLVPTVSIFFLPIVALCFELSGIRFFLESKGVVTGSEGEASITFFRQDIPILFLFIIASMMLAIMFFPFYAGLFDRWIRKVDRWCIRLINSIPFFSRAAKVQEDSRWLHTLADALRKGLPVPDSIRLCGDISVRNKQAKQSANAAQYAEQGVSIHQAIAQTKVIGKRAVAMVSLLPEGPSMISGLREIAKDMQDRLDNQRERQGVIFEVLSTLAVGFFLLVFLISMYLPLFGIPQFVGN